MKSITIVIPVYNGASTILNLVQTVLTELNQLKVEIVLVNDGSKDNSQVVCHQICQTYSNVKFLNLRKNFGEHNAVMCGLNYATNEYVAIIDDDFQNPPSEILKLLNTALKDDYDVVYSYYAIKKHTFLRNLGSQFNNLVATWLLNKPNNLYLSSFKLIKLDLVKDIIKYSGPFPYIDGLILRLTRNIGTVLVEHNQRMEGKSNYTISKLASLYFNMFINFSVKPIRFFTIIGILSFLLAVLFSFYIAYERLILNNTPPGWAFTTIQALALHGLEILFLGLIGEYLGKMFLDHNGTPQYSIKQQINIDDREKT
jgi:glycosyltransferase involved in cell wall biosynthesis